MLHRSPFTPKGSRDIRAPAVLSAINHVLARAAEKGVFTAIFANDRDYAMDMASRGWQVISIGTDEGWLKTMAKNLLSS